VSTARAVWFESPGVAALREETLRDPAAGEVLVEAICSGISAGTERLVLAGNVPPEAYAIMALPAMRGSFDLPVSYGYALVGTIAAVGTGVELNRLGERVLLLHPHHDRVVAPIEAIRPLPRDAPSERLVLLPSLETAINVVWDAGVALGDRVLVTGLGVVGLLIAHLAARAGAVEIVAVDPDPERRALAIALGATAAMAEPDPAVIAGCDVAIEASGSPRALALLVEHAGLEASVIVASWYGSSLAALPLGGRFHPHRVTLRSSQVGRIDPRRSARWTHARRWALAGELCRDADLDRLIAPSVPLSLAPAVYSELAAGVRWSPPQRVFDMIRRAPEPV
jgi:2-desacetyl-2-hydroxyethyl bacteriochlorophyllide A dehydrogenase